MRYGAHDGALITDPSSFFSTIFLEVCQMGKIKNSMYYYLSYETDLEEIQCIPENYKLWLIARSMLSTINQLEWEVALFRAGCTVDEVERIRRIEPPTMG